MRDHELFITRNGSHITTSSLRAALDVVGATDCPVLYMHTGMPFGVPNPSLGRTGLLEHLYEIVTSLGARTLCVPTFTFSFCNGQDYDVQRSKSKMGALNEYIRRLPEAVRSIDPLMSTVAVGEDLDLVRDLGKCSAGANSTFDKLHLRAGTKFLFFGTSLSDCFTYTHYIEERFGVPYRYDRQFTGQITEGERIWEDTYTLFVRYKGVTPSASRTLENALLSRDRLRTATVGDGSISCVAEVDGYEMVMTQLRENVNCYVAADPGDRDTEFVVRDMVSM